MVCLFEHRRRVSHFDHPRIHGHTNDQLRFWTARGRRASCELRKVAEQTLEGAFVYSLVPYVGLAQGNEKLSCSVRATTKALHTRRLVRSAHCQNILRSAVRRQIAVQGLLRRHNVAEKILISDLVENVLFRIDPYPKYDADVAKDDVFSFLEKLLRRLDVFLVRIKIRRPACRRFHQVLQGRREELLLRLLGRRSPTKVAGQRDLHAAPARRVLRRVPLPSRKWVFAGSRPPMSRLQEAGPRKWPYNRLKWPKTRL